MLTKHLRTLAASAVAAVALGGVVAGPALAAPTPTPTPTSSSSPMSNATRGSTNARGHAWTISGPSSSTGSVTITVKGAAPGERILLNFDNVDGRAGLDPDVAEHVFATGVAGSDGTARITVKAPGTWGSGARWTATLSVDGQVIGSQSFSSPGGSSKKSDKSSTTSPKQQKGGLAKTGV